MIQSSMCISMPICLPLAQWQRQYAKFSRTRLGQFTFLGVLAFLAYTGILFRLLNLLFILWWLAPLLILPLSNYLNKKASGPAVLILSALCVDMDMSCGIHIPYHCALPPKQPCMHGWCAAAWELVHRHCMQAGGCFSSVSVVLARQ